MAKTIGIDAKSKTQIKKQWEKQDCQSYFCFILFGFSPNKTVSSSTITVFYVEKLKNNVDGLKNDVKMELGFFMKLAEEYAKQHRYMLKFTQQEALYKVEAGIKPEELLDPSAWRISQWTFGKGIFYQNAAENYMLNQKESFGQLYLVKDTIKKDWTISYEKRMIGGLKCYKAVKKSKTKKGFDIEAWFTPEIPVPFGPGKFSGTPGLILELHYGPHSLTLKKLTYKKHLKIKKPEEGKLISAGELKDLFFKKKLELYQKIHSRNLR